MQRFAEIAFTPTVRQLQAERGSRDAYARMEQAPGPATGLGEHERAFLAAADSFFLASVGESGWPYVQHRGGPKGFVRVLSPSQIAYAEFRGNRQYVSAGNVRRDDRVALIVVDYPSRQRLKLLGRLRLQDPDAVDPKLLEAVKLPHYRARIEAVATIDVEAFDWNCPQHITPRFTEEEVAAAAQPLHEKIARLEAEVARLRSLPGKN